VRERFPTKAEHEHEHEHECEMEATMREGSYMEIEPGMKVLGPDGEGVGSVDQVVTDEASGIFHGLSVRHGLRGDTRMVPGEQVEAVRNGVVSITSRWEELGPYQPVEQRLAETQQEYV
jgi:sporulation protein YlmC with PRC-barrel domain